MPRLSFSPRTHGHCPQEILKSHRKYRQNMAPEGLVIKMQLISHSYYHYLLFKVWIPEYNHYIVIYICVKCPKWSSFSQEICLCHRLSAGSQEENNALLILIQNGVEPVISLVAEKISPPNFLMSLLDLLAFFHASGLELSSSTNIPAAFMPLTPQSLFFDFSKSTCWQINRYSSKLKKQAWGTKVSILFHPSWRKSPKVVLMIYTWKILEGLAPNCGLEEKDKPRCYSVQLEIFSLLWIFFEIFFAKKLRS